MNKESTPYDPSEHNVDYERGFIDGMQKQTQSTVEKWINKQSKKEWVGFTQEEHQSAIWTDGSFGAGFLLAEKLLKEKNT
jgi:hypothetical protein